MAIRVKSNESRQLYAEFVPLCADWTVYHTPEWLDFLDEFALGECEILGIYRDETLVGMLPGRKTKLGPLRLFGSPMPGWCTSYLGPVWREPVAAGEFQPAFVEFMRRERYHHVEILAHDYPMEASHGWTAESSHTIVAGLYSEPEAMLKSFGKSCRKDIHRAERAGVRVAFTDEERFIDIYYGQLEEVFNKQRRHPTYPIGRVRALWKHLKPTHRLLTSWAMIDDRVIATRIDMIGNGMLHSFGSASRQDSLRFYPNEILRFHVMSWAGQNGMREFDMSGRGDYKQKFNAVPRATVRLMYSARWLQMARNIAASTYRLSKRRIR